MMSFFFSSETLPLTFRLDHKSDSDHDNDDNNKSKKLYSIYYVPGTILSALHNLAH